MLFILPVLVRVLVLHISLAKGAHGKSQSLGGTESPVSSSSRKTIMLKFLADENFDNARIFYVFKPFLRILQHKRNAFERSCPISSDLKPIVSVEKIRKFYSLKSYWISNTRVLCTTKEIFQRWSHHHQPENWIRFTCRRISSTNNNSLAKITLIHLIVSRYNFGSKNVPKSSLTNQPRYGQPQSSPHSTPSHQTSPHRSRLASQRQPLAHRRQQNQDNFFFGQKCTKRKTTAKVIPVLQSSHQTFLGNPLAL